MHTPGPWYVGGVDGLSVFAGTGGATQKDAKRLVAGVARMNDEAREDATLIAAAPELLEVARAYIDAVCFCDRNHVDERGDYICSCWRGSDNIKKVRAIIAKATGRPQ